jgi:protein SCO1/2
LHRRRLTIDAQPFSWKAGVLFLCSGIGLIYYFRYEKARMERKRIAEATKGVGKPKVGGPFELVDQNRKPFSAEDMKGKFALVSLTHALICHLGTSKLWNGGMFLDWGRHSG